MKGNIITIIHLCCTNFNGQFRKLKIQTQVCTQRCVHVYIIIITAFWVLFLIKLRWPSCETQLFNWWQLEYNSGYLHVALTETKNIFLLIKKHTSWLASLCYEWGKPITENSTLVNKWFTWIVSKVQQTDCSQFNWQLTYRYGLTTFGLSYFILALRPFATESSQKNFSWKKIDSVFKAFDERLDTAVDQIRHLHESSEQLQEWLAQLETSKTRDESQSPSGARGNNCGDGSEEQFLATDRGHTERVYCYKRHAHQG